MIYISDIYKIVMNQIPALSSRQPQSLCCWHVSEGVPVHPYIKGLVSCELCTEHWMERDNSECCFIAYTELIDWRVYMAQTLHFIVLRECNVWLRDLVVSDWCLQFIANSILSSSFHSALWVGGRLSAFGYFQYIYIFINQLCFD